MVEYKHEEYMQGMSKIKAEIDDLIVRGHVHINVVGIHRGSLPMAVHLSNILPARMSIINYQTRDGNSKVPEFVVNTIEPHDTIIVLDDIYDSGKTITNIKDKLEKEYPGQYIKPMVLFGKDNEQDCYYAHEHTGEWIEFPWEAAVDFR